MAADDHILIAPAGKFHTAGGADWDIWLGSCFIQGIMVGLSAAAGVIVRIYDGYDTNTSNVVRGGGSSANDRFRVLLTAGTVSEGPDPAITGTAAIASSVSNLRTIYSQTVYTSGAGTVRLEPMVNIPMGALVVATYVSGTTPTCSLTVEYIPQVRGAVRKRQATSQTEPAAFTNSVL